MCHPAHLASPTVNLATHIQDVVNVLHYEDLTDVVLVGHRHVGIVITGVAERVPQRVARLVYSTPSCPRMVRR